MLGLGPNREGKGRLLPPAAPLVEVENAGSDFGAVTGLNGFCNPAAKLASINDAVGMIMTDKFCWEWLGSQQHLLLMGPGEDSSSRGV